MKLPFPTIRNLMDMAKFTTIDELFDWANTRTQGDIVKLRPIRIQKNGKSQWAVWGDDGYPADRPL